MVSFHLCQRNVIDRTQVKIVDTECAEGKERTQRNTERRRCEYADRIPFIDIRRIARQVRCRSPRYFDVLYSAARTTPFSMWIVQP